MISYRQMTPADIPSGLNLCRLSGWNQLDRDWKLFLQLSPNACRVAVSDKGVVGTVATITYQRLFSWIGMVLVDPSYQRQGIGINLLREALHLLRDEETVKLDATPAGRAVYMKLDFVDEYKLGRMVLKGKKEILSESIARPVRESDLSRLSEFDAGIFGADRGALLRWMWKGAPQFAYIAEHQKEITGFCLGRNGYNAVHIGPVVSKDIYTAKQLLSAALQNSSTWPVITDAIYLEPTWIEWLEGIGFKEQRPFIRMYRGANRFAGIPAQQFAILGPEFG